MSGGLLQFNTGFNINGNATLSFGAGSVGIVDSTSGRDLLLKMGALASIRLSDSSGSGSAINDSIFQFDAGASGGTAGANRYGWVLDFEEGGTNTDSGIDSRAASIIAVDNTATEPGSLVGLDIDVSGGSNAAKDRIALRILGNVITLKNATALGTTPTDFFQFYSTDIVAGNAAPHFKTENGDVIKLYKTNTYTRNATVVTDRTLLASASATATNNNNVLAALIEDVQALGLADGT